MEVASTKTDNIAEILTQIIEFTERRREVLSRNIFDFERSGFVPNDLPMEEFSECMTRAISEHICNERLLFCDSPHVRFESGGSLQTDPVADLNAWEMLRLSPERYLQEQMKKLSENMMNNRIACELLRYKQPGPAIRS